MPTRPKKTLKRALTMKERRAATQDRLNHRHAPPSVEGAADPLAAVDRGRPLPEPLAPREEVRPRKKNAAR